MESRGGGTVLYHFSAFCVALLADETKKPTVFTNSSYVDCKLACVGVVSRNWDDHDAERLGILHATY
jgi:hypothetical protein